MRVVTSHLSGFDSKIGNINSYDLVPIYGDKDIVAGYAETVGVTEGPGGKLQLIYGVRAIAWDFANSTFVNVPARVFLRRSYGRRAFVYEFVEVPDDGMALEDVDYCVAIEVNGKSRMSVDGSGTVILLEDDVDSPQREKSYESFYDPIHVDYGQQIVEGELLVVPIGWHSGSTGLDIDCPFMTPDKDGPDPDHGFDL